MILLPIKGEKGRIGMNGAKKSVLFHGLFIIFLISIFAGYFGCAYSFSGAAVAPHLKSIAIPIVEDRSGKAIANLSRDMTGELTRKFIEDNNLRIADRTSANSILEVVITSYTDELETIGSSDGKTATRKVTISAQGIYKDMVKKKTVFEKQFSGSASFPTSNAQEGLLTAQKRAIDKITDDILLETVSGW